MATDSTPLVRRISSPHPAAWAGVAFAVLFLVGYFMVESAPTASATDAELLEYYTSSDRTAVVVAALYVVPFSGIAFIWFLAALRQRVQSVAPQEEMVFATVQLVSGVLFLAMMFVAAAARVAPVLAIEVGNEQVPDIERELLRFSQATLMVFALRSAGVFMITTATRVARVGVVPRWFRLVSLAAALVLMLSASYLEGLVLIFPVWVGVISLFVLFRDLRAQLAAVEA